MSESPWTVVSPDGRLAFEIVATRDDGQPALAYRILHDDTEIVAESRLGIEHTSGRLSGVFVAAVSDAVAIQETYHLLHGKQRVVEVDARERIATFCNEAGDEGQLVVRVSNDGAAFRYRVTGTPAGESQLTAELTEFHLGEGHTWIQPHDAATLFTPAYEALYANAIPIGSPEPGPSWNMPALFHTSDRWVLIAESDLVPPAVGMHLSAAADGTYRMVPPEPDEGLGLGDVWPTFDGMWQSPWRVIVVAESLDGIVETTLITDLASPSKIEDTTWITPGRASWSWWSDHDSPQSLPDLYRYADFAAEMGWEHTMVDANWDVHSDADIAALAQYAHERGGRDVALVQLGWPAQRSHRTATRSRCTRRRSDAPSSPSSPTGASRASRSTSSRATSRMASNSCGTCSPTQQTSGSWSTCTGARCRAGGTARGRTSCPWRACAAASSTRSQSEFPETAIWHNTILPYTRNVIGPMDYTPVTISDQLYPHLTSTRTRDRPRSALRVRRPALRRQHRVLPLAAG